MKGSNPKGYTTRFNDLALLCPSMVNLESKKVERYVWGLAPKIKEMVLSSKPTTYLYDKRLALQLIKTKSNKDQWWKKLKLQKLTTTTTSANSTEEIRTNKKKQQTEKVYDVASAPIPTQQKCYIGNKPFMCPMKPAHIGEFFHCTTCNKKGHTANIFRGTTLVVVVQERGNGSGSSGGGSYFEYGENGHYRRN